MRKKRTINELNLVDSFRQRLDKPAPLPSPAELPPPEPKAVVETSSPTPIPQQKVWTAGSSLGAYRRYKMRRRVGR